MKKLLLVFGLPGSGDVELINNISNNSNNIREKLGISNLIINYLELPYERDTSFSICIGKSIRKDTINSKIRDFSYDYNDILIIKCEGIDCYENNSMLDSLVINFPDIEKEIIYMCPDNKIEFYSRMTKTEWFMDDYNNNIKKFPIEWLDFSTDYMRNSLLKYTEFGFDYCEIDSINGYNIKNIYIIKNK